MEDSPHILRVSLITTRGVRSLIFSTPTQLLYCSTLVFQKLTSNTVVVVA